MTSGWLSEAQARVFRNYLEEAIGQDNAAVAFSALEEPASVSVRKNPRKPSPLPAGEAGRVPWCRSGFFLDSRPVFTLDPAFHAGAYYVQDSSSMFVGHVFRAVLDRVKVPDDRPLRVLDLCAAPGGKTTDIAASLREAYGSRFILVSNEVMSQRVSVLASNTAVWGDPCIVVTSDDPSRFASMRGWFDIVVADVPCSGEGMFRKDPGAREQWSADTVKLCQGRQRRIVADVWPALAEGGVMIYSTCTFNRYENDDNVRWISDTLGAGPLFPDTGDAGFLAGEGGEGVLGTGMGFCLVPGLVRGEGQYCAALLKTSPESQQRPGRTGSGRHGLLKGSEAELVASFFTDDMIPVSRDGVIKVLPRSAVSSLPFIEDRLHVVSSGCSAGEMKRGTLVPDADMALSLAFRKESFSTAELDTDTALSYLQGNQIVLRDMPAGYTVVCHRSLPLGFVKNLGARCNNLYPRSRRIRMEIKK